MCWSYFHRSLLIYEKEDEAFIRWKETNKISIVDDDAILNYLHKKVSVDILSI